MSKNKKFSGAVFLLTSFVLMLCCETVVNQVLCHRNDGTVNIEPAFLGFQCHCENDHSHFESETCDRSCSPPSTSCCYDLPLDDTWLKRNITHRAFEIEIDNIIQYHLSIQIDLQLSDPFIRLPESVPLSKFLYKIPPLKNSTVLRC